MTDEEIMMSDREFAEHREHPRPESEMVVRVARALCDYEYEHTHPWEKRDHHAYKEYYLDAAKAIIVAIREPTPKMEDAVWPLCDQGGDPHPHDDAPIEESWVPSVWRAMIDAALRP